MIEELFLCGRIVLYMIIGRGFTYEWKKNTYFNISVLLKLTLASMTFCYYLFKRKVDEINSYNEKALYENPFSLPMALVYSKFNEGMDKTNPFEYQNSIYWELAGNDSKIYQKLEYFVEKLDGNNSYSIQIPSGNYAVYGNIPYNNALNATLDVNSIYSIFYPKAASVLQSLDYDYEMIFINDGSKDDTLKVLKELSEKDENVERAAGETKWSFWKLLKYAIDGIINFSQAPLCFAS